MKFYLKISTHINWVFAESESFLQRRDFKFPASALIQTCPNKKGMTDPTCQLPDCWCSEDGRRFPSNLSFTSRPQFVVLTFDDPVDLRAHRMHRKLFHDGKPLLNKNGCPMRGTFFVSHEWTRYDLVEWLYLNGHEIASNSIT